MVDSISIIIIIIVRIKEVVCFGEGAGANILARFAVSFNEDQDDDDDDNYDVDDGSGTSGDRYGWTTIVDVEQAVLFPFQFITFVHQHSQPLYHRHYHHHHHHLPRHQMANIKKVMGVCLLHTTGTTAGLIDSLKDKVDYFNKYFL